MTTPTTRTGTSGVTPSGITRQTSIGANKLIRNTYILLSLTLAFSAATAGISMVFNLPHPGIVITLVGYFGLLFLTTRFRDRALGLVFVFALTGFMGFTLGPIVSMYLKLPNGAALVMNALGATAVTFVGLSAYALTSRKDFSFMGGFLMAGIIVAFLAGLGAMFFDMHGLSLVVSAMFVVLMAGLILYQTSAMVNGGETNYIMATITLYVSIYNLFTSLLHLMGAVGDD